MTSLDILSCPLAGRVLIEASAGTGKTYALVHLYLRLLLERGLDVDRILVVTFTEAATQELRGRIRQQLNEALAVARGRRTADGALNELLRRCPDQAASRLVRALQQMDLAQVSTIHAFCQTVLLTWAFQSGTAFGAELLVDQAGLLTSVVQDFWRQYIYRESEPFVRCLLRHEITVEKLAEMVSGWLGNPFLRLWPPPPENPGDMEQAYQTWQARYRELQALWPQVRSAFHTWFPGVLNGGTYKLKQFDLWQTQLERYFSWPEGGMDLPDCFEKFCQSTIDGKVNKGQSAPQHPFFQAADNFCQQLYQLEEYFQERFLAMKHELFAYSWKRIQQFKQSRNKLTFDDLLLNLHGALHEEQGQVLAATLRRQFPVALIDEFQDTDRVQFEIFAKIYNTEDTGLFLIGDPKQSIYRFRGADIFTYLRAANDPAQLRLSLDTNWRSDPGLLQAVAALFGHIQDPFQPASFKLPAPGIHFVDVKAAQTGGKYTPAMPFWHIDGQGRTLEWVRQQVVAAVANEIRDLAGQGVSPGDMAVLVRKNSQAELVRDALEERGIPCIVYGAGRIFSTAEAEAVEHVLRAIQSPGHGGWLKAALATDLIGLDGNRLDQLQQDEAALEEWVDAFRGYQLTWLEKGFISMWQALLHQQAVYERLGSLPQARRRLANLRQISTLLEQRSLGTHMGMSGLLAWLGKQRSQQPGQKEEEDLQELESDAAAVRIVTVHRSKGLEYPIVFCPFLWDGSGKGGLFPNYFDPLKGELVVDLSPGAAKGGSAARYQLETWAEDMRLAYVALTRAQHRCYVTWAAAGKKHCPWSALAYLLNFYGLPLEDLDVKGTLAALQQKSGGHLQLVPLPRRGEPLPGQELPVLAPCREGREVDTRWRMASFSSLTAHVQASLPQPDRDEEEPGEEAEGEKLDIYHFPRGSKTGDFWHHLLETCDFTWDADRLRVHVEAKCKIFGYDPKWHDTLAGMVRNTLATPLQPGLKLAGIPVTRRLVEMEFHFPLRPIRARELEGLMRQHSPFDVPSLRFQRLEGMMKGFVDLIFEQDGVYYLADYKSNHLGSNREDYRTENLRAAMEAHHYVLQAYIYTVALDRFLTLRLPGYRYAEHCGGAFYLFLRGLDPQAGAGYGVFHHKPDPELIAALGAYLVAGSTTPG